MSTRQPTIIECMDEPDLWARWFRDRATWQAWRAFLRAFFALPMSEATWPFTPPVRAAQRLLTRPSQSAGWLSGAAEENHRSSP
jgi:hypothetical protein